jgi:hypothetical protein
MDKNSLSISAFISWVMKFLLLMFFFYVTYKGDYLFAIVSLLAVGISLTPSIYEKNYNITLPFELDLLVTLSMFFHIFLGEGMFFYEKVHIWDKFLHFYGSSLVALMIFITTYTFHYTKHIRLNVRIIGFITVVASFAIGAFWEIIEFVVDQTLARDMQNGNTDTMWDLIYDLSGGIVVGVLGVIYIIKSHPEDRKKLAMPISQIFKTNRRN